MAHESQRDARTWLDYATIDHSAAVTLYEYHHPQPYEIICYHCQQAAEKAIKAVYIFFDLPGGIPRKHDLSFLLNQLQHTVVIERELRAKADALNVYGIVARYPNEIQLDDNRTRQALQYAKVFLDWADEIINHP